MQNIFPPDLSRLEIDQIVNVVDHIVNKTEIVRGGSILNFPVPWGCPKKFKITPQTQVDMKNDFWIALMTRLNLPDSKNLNRTECVVSDSKPNWIGSNRTDWTGPIGLNRKQHEKIGLTGLNRTERVVRADWIETDCADCIAHAWRR